MQHRTGGVTTVAALILIVSGCTVGEPIGGEAWLDYEGPNRDAVIACVKALPSTIESPNGYPAATQFTEVEVESVPRNDVVTDHFLSGQLKLVYGGGDDLVYRWTCHVSERYSILRVLELSHDLR